MRQNNTSGLYWRKIYGRKKKTGLLRNEITEVTGIPNSGYLTKMLDELISCGFIRKTYCIREEDKRFAISTDRFLHIILLPVSAKEKR